MKSLNLAISIDDVNPSNVQADLKDPLISKIISINERYGSKVTFFVPANFLGKFNLKDYKAWCQFIDSLDFVEVAAHGYLHDFEDLDVHTDYKEFSKMNYEKTLSRINQIKESFIHFSSKEIEGWKMPGWEFNIQSLKAISENYKYLYPHPEHINIYKSVSKNARIINSKNTYDIQSNIPYQTLEDGPLILHSHVDGQTNGNRWTEYNFARLQLNLVDIFQFFKVNTSFVKEL
jgi:hypothetical protein